ncbi:MAG: hypothetical protein AAFY90_10245, partial [Pseudomonadota bacterium]
MPITSTRKDDRRRLWVSMAVAAAVGAWLFTVWPRPVHEVPLHIYLTEAETVRFDGPALPAGAQADWDRQFADARFFAAFAVSDGGRWGWALDRHSVAAARAEALAWCNGWALRGCAVVAERRPVGYRADDLAHSLSERAVDMGRNARPERGVPVVWAISSDGSWYADQPAEVTVAAAARARQICQQFATGLRAPFFPSRRCVAGIGPLVLI